VPELPGRLDRYAVAEAEVSRRGAADKVRHLARVSTKHPYACRVGLREERVARNEVAAREVNEAIEDADTRPANSFIHVLCECGLEDCERVLAITRPGYQLARSDPRQFVILPSHLHSEVEDVVQESDGLFIVAKHGGTPEDIAVRTDPRR
jgi:hypothetical protein